MGGRTDPASCPAALQRTACCPFPCATCPLPSVLGRAADSQCPHSYPEPTSDHVVRRSWPLCRFPRPFDGVSAPPRHQYACSSDIRGTLCCNLVAHRVGRAISSPFSSSDAYLPVLADL